MSITIEPFKIPRITNEQLKEYAEASGDFNPIHLDDDVAKKAGLPGRIAHGMLSMAYLAQQAEKAAAQLGGKLQSMQTRFKSMTFPGDDITITSVIRPGVGANADWLVILEARNQKGELTTNGEAKITTK